MSSNITMTVKEAAGILSISLPKMYDITERADFDALIRVGTRKIIHTAKFFDWIERQTIKDIS